MRAASTAERCHLVGILIEALAALAVVLNDLGDFEVVSKLVEAALPIVGRKSSKVWLLLTRRRHWKVPIHHWWDSSLSRWEKHMSASSVKRINRRHSGCNLRRLQQPTSSEAGNVCYTFIISHQDQS